MMPEHTKECLPRLSIVLPVYNEEGFIEKCLSSIVSQDYPKDRLEVLVVDGMSSDGTRQLVRQLAVEHPYIRLLDNPGRVAGAAINVGIKESRSDIIVRLDAHTYYFPDYLSRGVEYLARIGADCVGGPVNAVGSSLVSKAIALATSSMFGIGNAQQHYRRSEGWLDTVPFPFYLREVFDRVGLFDEEQPARQRLERIPLLGRLKLRWCNEDDDFNYRLREGGGKIYYTPKIRSRYYNRATLRGLWRQHFQYGFWKVRVLQRNRRMMRIRHLVPGAFVLSLVASGILGLFFSPSLVLFWLILGSYLTASLLFSTNISRQKGLRYFLILPIVFAILHLGYGSGYLLGSVIFADMWFKDE